MELITTIPGGNILLVDDAEQATWESDNPAVGDFLINTESGKIAYMSEAGTVEEISFGGGGALETHVLYDFVASGSSYVNVGLIGKPIVLFLLDGIQRVEVASSPDAGFEFTYDDTTGTIDIGTDFEDNRILIQYKGTAIPPP
jgi:hypothetical protein